MLTKAYLNLLIVKVVIDFDILNNTNPLKDIFTEAGGNWSEISNDWSIVKVSIDAKRPEFETRNLKEEIVEFFDSINERIIPKEKISDIPKKLKKSISLGLCKRSQKNIYPKWRCYNSIYKASIKFKI